MAAVACYAAACGPSEPPLEPGSGGVIGAGGNGAGAGSATNTGGETTATGGARAATGGTAESGGPAGGAPTGGPASGGSATGGAASGGSATGGAASGGSATGGSPAGATGGTTGTCPLPTTFKWTSTGPLAQPKSGWVALKDFSSVVHDNQHIVYMSTVDGSGAYGGAMMTFTDWAEMATATQTPLPYGGIAPTLIYFRPKDIWVLLYEWGPWSFTYLTSDDPTSASGWAGPYNLYEGNSISAKQLASFSNATRWPMRRLRSCRKGRPLRHTVLLFLTRPSRRVTAPGMPTPTGRLAETNPQSARRLSTSPAVASTTDS